MGATAPFPGISYGQAILAEAIGTFLLMFVIMGVAVDQRAPPGFAGLVIGLTVGGIIITIGNITGSSLNPARMAFQENWFRQVRRVVGTWVW